jgi:hypothetical protein
MLRQCLQLLYVVWKHVEVPLGNPNTCSIWNVFLSWQVAWLPWALNHGLLNVFLPVPTTHSSTCVRHSQTIFQEHAVPFHNVLMWRNMETIVLASKSSLGPCNAWKFPIPHNALCSLLRCDHYAAELPVHPPFTLRGHLSYSYSNKLLRDTSINFLYTTAYFSSISNGLLCILRKLAELATLRIYVW